MAQHEVSLEGLRAGAGLRLKLLGPPGLERCGEPVQLGTRKALAILAYLAVRREAVPRSELDTLLWPEHDEQRARRSLRDELSRLGHVLGPAIRARNDVSLAPGDLEADLWRFQRALAEARPAQGKFLQGAGKRRGRFGKIGYQPPPSPPRAARVLEELPTQHAAPPGNLLVPVRVCPLGMQGRSGFQSLSFLADCLRA